MIRKKKLWECKFIAINIIGAHTSAAVPKAVDLQLKKKNLCKNDKLTSQNELLQKRLKNRIAKRGKKLIFYWEILMPKAVEACWWPVAYFMGRLSGPAVPRI